MQPIFYYVPLFPGFLTLGLSGLFQNSQVSILVTDVKEFCPKHLQICRLLNCPERLTPNESGQSLLQIIVFNLLPVNKQNA